MEARSMVRSIIAAIVLLASGCTKPPEEWRSGWPGKESTILLQISAMPTDAFLKAVDEDVNLTADEKTLIAKWTRGPGAYTHARLAKYKQGENLFIAIDRYRPTEDMVKDSQGQIRGVGPCGSIMVLKMREGRWKPEGASFYD
jgi:hypothetical protein